MAFKFPDKDPDERLDYTVDWSRFLSTGESIDTSTSGTNTSVWKIQKTDGSYVEFGPNQSFQNDVTLEDVTNTRTAQANGAVTNSTSLTLDTNVGTIVVGQRVTGAGITGNVYVTAVASQTSITVSTAITVADDTLLTFTTHGLTLLSSSFTGNGGTRATIVLSKGIANISHRLLCQIRITNGSDAEADRLVTNREINLRVRERS